MQRRIATTIIITLWLSVTVLGIAVAQSESPLRGIPHMSNEPDGPVMREFSSGTDVVYLVFEYETEGPVEIIAEIRSEEQQGAVLFISRETYEGTGTANIEVEGPGESAFPDGVYDTIIRFGEKRHVTAGWEWVVGDIQLPDDETSGQQAPISPLQENGSSAQSNPPSDPQSSTGNAASLSPAENDQAAAPPVRTTASSGLSPMVLGGVGVVVLILLIVIAWAIRGFVTAEA